jgi:adenosylmethionine-8-amino-7-oxononanoate aminotransferase
VDILTKFLFEVEFVDLPTASNFEEVRSHFQTLLHKNDVAAFIFEPLVQGSAGMLMYEAAFLDELIKIAQQVDVLCIADEVMTGFGRTGKLFATDYLQYQPDIYCLSKGITGGFLPLGITTCTQKMYDAFVSHDKLKTFFHGHSYTGNPIACAAAAASLRILKNAQDKIDQLVHLQTYFVEKLQVHPKIENIRQAGTIVAFEVKSNTSSDYFNNIRDVLYENFIKRGVMLRPLGNTVYVLPPYVITEQQLLRVYEVIEEVLELA